MVLFFPGHIKLTSSETRTQMCVFSVRVYACDRKYLNRLHSRSRPRTSVTHWKIGNHLSYKRFLFARFVVFFFFFASLEFSHTIYTRADVWKCFCTRKKLPFFSRLSREWNELRALYDRGNISYECACHPPTKKKTLWIFITHFTKWKLEIGIIK